MSDNTLRIDCLGTLQARVGTARFSLNGTKMRSLLALLALNAGSVMHRDQLIEELSLQDSTGDPVNALHANVARLRKWFMSRAESQIVETVESGYRLRLERQRVDACWFVSQTERALQLGSRTPAVAAAMLEDGLKLWRGSGPLQDVYEGPYLDAAAQDLNRLRAIAREELVVSWIRTRQFQRVIIYSRRFLTDDPLNERLYAGLIFALRMMGRHAEAVESFRTVERLLHRELGISPSQLVKDAYRSTMYHDAGPNFDLTPESGIGSSRSALLSRPADVSLSWAHAI